MLSKATLSSADDALYLGVNRGSFSHLKIRFPFNHGPAVETQIR